MSRRKALETILQDVVVFLRANVNGLEGVDSLVDLGLVDKTPAGC
jgi:hypothetical protein